MRFSRSRVRGVLRKSRCRSSMNRRNTRPAASLVGRLGGQDDALLRRRRRRRLNVVDATAVREHERHDVLLDAVFEDLEIAGLQVRHELVAVVADDDVGRDEIDADTEGRLLRRGRLRLRGAAAAVPRRLRAIRSANAPAHKNLAVFRMARVYPKPINS